MSTKTQEVGMAVENRNLGVGTRLVATYKKQTHVCDVVQTDEGVRFKLADGRAFKSPSAAASAVMGGQAANGWRFWSVEGDGASSGEPASTEAQEGQGGEDSGAAATTAAKRRARIIRKLPNQTGAPEGQVHYFCAACAGSFFAPAGAAPEACPKGHRAELDGNGDLVTEPPVVDEAPAGDETDEAARDQATETAAAAVEE